MTTALSHELEPRVMTSTALTPDLAAASKDLWTNGSGTRIGFWDCQPGAFNHQCVGFTEICQILTGTVIVEEHGGTTATLTAGDALVMPSGWQGTWRVKEYVRKMFVVINDTA